VLEITALRAGYEPEVVIDVVNLTVDRGEWCTVLGPNGSGKTTLLRAVVGQLTPCGGAIRICGFSLRDERPDALRHVGFACPPEKLPGLLTGRQCLEVYAAAKELDRIDEEVLELSAALRFDQYFDRYVDTYSLGTRQKLSVLLALLGSPSLVVLDEAFNGLDPASSLLLKRHLRSRIEEARCGVFLATHAIDVAEHFSETVVLLLDGHIVRIWDQMALQAIKSGKVDSLEIELAAAAI
jgi:ABC-2 type transport system ATP-binding protein